MIYFIVRNLKFGGIQRVNVRLAEALNSRGIAAELLVFEKSGDDYQTKVPVTYAKDIKLESHDILFTNNGGDVFRLVRIHPFFPFHTKWFHIQHSELNPSVTGKLARTIQYMAFWGITFLASGVVFVSREMRDSFAKKSILIRKKSTVINNPIMKQKSYSETAFSSERRKNILHVGRISFQKNQLKMLAIFKELKLIKGFEDYSLTIAGDGDTVELESQATAFEIRNSVKFVGHVSNIDTLMKEHDALCLTSRWEGLPTVLVEAAFYSPRVFATHCKFGVEELVTAALGVLEYSDNHQTIAQSLAKCLQSPPISTDERSLENFFFEKSADAYLELIEGKSE